MTKTLIDVDDALLAGCQRVLGTNSKKATVNSALGEVVRLAAVREFLQYTGGEPVLNAGGPILVDATALAHLAQPSVSARLMPLLTAGSLATCAAVDHETLSLVRDPGEYTKLADVRRIAFRWLPTDDADLRTAADVQAELIGQGQHLPWTRLVIAVVAHRHAVSLLHYTNDYDLITKVTGQDAEWVAPSGTLPEPLSERPHSSPGP